MQAEGSLAEIKYLPRQALSRKYCAVLMLQKDNGKKINETLLTLNRAHLEKDKKCIVST